MPGLIRFHQNVDSSSSDEASDDDAQFRWWRPQAAPSDYAEAIRLYSNNPANYDVDVNTLVRTRDIDSLQTRFTGYDVCRQIPSDHVQHLTNGRAIPLGDLSYHLIYGRNVHPGALDEETRNTFDYHGLPLNNETTGSVTYTRLYPLTNGRPSRWEEELIRELDAYFGRYRRWPDQSTLVGHRLAELTTVGLTPANWQRMQRLQNALSRNNLPLTQHPTSGRWVVDEYAYHASAASSRRYQQVVAANVNGVNGTNGVNGHAGVRRRRDDRDSESPSPTRPSARPRYSPTR